MNRPIKHIAKHLAAAVLIAAAVMSCTVGTAVLETDGNTKSAITFSAFTTTMPTKGAINAPDTILGYWDATASQYVAGKGIGVFAFHQPAKSNGYPVDFNSHTGEPTFMYNQKVERTSADGTNFTFSYTPQKYWPNNENDQLSFFAYAPYDPATAWEDLGMVANLKGTKITRHYYIENDIEDQQDFLWADPVLNQKKPSVASAIQFNFKHLCAKVGFALGVNDGSAAAGTTTSWTDATTTITVDRIDIKDIYKEFTYNFTWNGTAWDTGYSDIDGNQDVRLSATSGHLKNNVISSTAYTAEGFKQLNADNCWLMIAPQTGLSMVLHYTVTTTDGSFQSTFQEECPIQLATALEASKQNIVKFLISPTGLSVSSDIVDWTSSGDIDVNIP